MGFGLGIQAVYLHLHRPLPYLPVLYRCGSVGDQMASIILLTIAHFWPQLVWKASLPLHAILLTQLLFLHLPCTTCRLQVSSAFLSGRLVPLVRCYFSSGCSLPDWRANTSGHVGQSCWSGHFPSTQRWKGPRPAFVWLHLHYLGPGRVSTGATLKYTMDFVRLCHKRSRRMTVG